MKKLMILLALLLAVLTGCGEQEVLTEKSQTIDPAEIHTIDVNLRDRGIRVSPSADGQIHLEYADSETESLAVSVQNGVLTVVLEANKEWTDYFGKKPAGTLSMELPEVIWETLSLTTTNGDISLTALTVGTLNLNVNNGNLEFETLDAEKEITLTAKNGNIDGEIVGGYDDFDISCTMKKGDSNLPEAKPGGDKTLTVDMNNGDVNIEFVK